MPLVHATCVDWSGRGVLLRGKSGVGKSDLALRLIEAGAVLVADDQTLLDGNQASAPEALRGLLEVRGLGILRLPFKERTTIALTVDLKPSRDIERLPAFDTLRQIEIDPFCASAVLKIKVALQIVSGERSLISQTES